MTRTSSRPPAQNVLCRLWRVLRGQPGATRALLVALGAFIVLSLCASSASADAYVRVIAQRAPVYTGPGGTAASGSYRELYRAERGEIFEVLERGTRGFWFRIKLEDGTTGWIFGELVFPFEVVESDDPGIFTRMWRAFRGALLGPSPVPESDVQVSFSAGILDQEGVFLLRPAWIIDPYFAIEAFIGLSPRGTKDLFIGGAGLTLRLVPGAALSPYVHAGAGSIYQRPKADNFIDEEQTLMAVSTGGGFEITFKKQITLRIDFRNWTIFDENEASNGQEYSGGLAIFF